MKKNFLLKNGWEMSWSDDNWVRSDKENKEANTGIPTDMAYRQSLGESVVALNCKLIPNNIIENENMGGLNLHNRHKARRY